MNQRRQMLILAAIIVASCAAPVEPQKTQNQKPMLYVVATSHLDWIRSLPSRF